LVLTQKKPPEATPLRRPIWSRLWRGRRSQDRCGERLSARIATGYLSREIVGEIRAPSQTLRAAAGGGGGGPEKKKKRNMHWHRHDPLGLFRIHVLAGRADRRGTLVYWFRDSDVQVRPPGRRRCGRHSDILLVGSSPDASQTRWARYDTVAEVAYLAERLFGWN
jgi:hypothetical protein